MNERDGVLVPTQLSCLVQQKQSNRIGLNNQAGTNRFQLRCVVTIQPQLDKSIDRSRHQHPTRVDQTLLRSVISVRLRFVPCLCFWRGRAGEFQEARRWVQLERTRFVGRRESPKMQLANRHKAPVQTQSGGDFNNCTLTNDGWDEKHQNRNSQSKNTKYKTRSARTRGNVLKLFRTWQGRMRSRQQRPTTWKRRKAWTGQTKPATCSEEGALGDRYREPICSAGLRSFVLPWITP